MKKLNFEIEINAPKEKVWNIMLADSTYREWTKAFSENSSFVGDWSKGSQIKFVDNDGNGMLSQIAENIEGTTISIEHVGMIENGIEDRNSEKIKSWMPAFENYYFESIDENKTKLKIELDISEEWETMMSDSWPKALEKLKEICEK